MYTSTRVCYFLNFCLNTGHALSVHYVAYGQMRMRSKQSSLIHQLHDTLSIRPCCNNMLTSKFNLILILIMSPLRHQQTGAVEACWAHNPEVRGSKPRSAKIFGRPNATAAYLRWCKRDCHLFFQFVFAKVISPAKINQQLCLYKQRWLRFIKDQTM